LNAKIIRLTMQEMLENARRADELLNETPALCRMHGPPPNDLGIASQVIEKSGCRGSQFGSA
jgi:hypothetical protein